MNKAAKWWKEISEKSDRHDCKNPHQLVFNCKGLNISGVGNSCHFIGLLWGLNEIIKVEHSLPVDPKFGNYPNCYDNDYDFFFYMSIFSEGQVVWPDFSTWVSGHHLKLIILHSRNRFFWDQGEMTEGTNDIDRGDRFKLYQSCIFNVCLLRLLTFRLWLDFLI